MNELPTGCVLADFGPPQARRPRGGPWTVEGKRNSSQNARTHGCRSKEKILPGERREDYDAVWQQWLEVYAPETEGDLAQLEQVVDCAWRLQRTEEAYTDVERALRSESTNAAEWRPELLQRLQLMQRYRTTAENSFHKAVRMLEFLKGQRDAERRERDRKAAAKAAELALVDAQDPARAELRRKMDAEFAAWQAEQNKPTPAQALFRGQHAAKPQLTGPMLQQWAEITVELGQTVTELWPSNAELIAEGQRMLPPPQFVERHLNLPDGIPAEYEWLGVQDAAVRARGGCGVQRMTADSWLMLIAQEGEHLLPAPAGEPAAEEGQCGCARCAARLEIWQEQLASR